MTPDSAELGCGPTWTGLAQARPHLGLAQPHSFRVCPKNANFVAVASEGRWPDFSNSRRRRPMSVRFGGRSRCDSGRFGSDLTVEFGRTWAHFDQNSSDFKRCFPGAEPASFEIVRPHSLRCRRLRTRPYRGDVAKPCDSGHLAEQRWVLLPVRRRSHAGLTALAADRSGSWPLWPCHVGARPQHTPLNAQDRNEGVSGATVQASTP